MHQHSDVAFATIDLTEPECSRLAVALRIRQRVPCGIDRELRQHRDVVLGVVFDHPEDVAPARRASRLQSCARDALRKVVSEEAHSGRQIIGSVLQPILRLAHLLRG